MQELLPMKRDLD